MGRSAILLAWLGIAATLLNGCIWPFVEQQTEGGQLQVKASANPIRLQQGQPSTLLVAVSGGTAPYSYQWSADGWEGSDQRNPVVSPDTETTYTVTVTDSSDPAQTASDSVTLRFNDLTVTAAASPAVIVPGNSSELSAEVTGGNEPFTYSWSADGWEGSSGASVTVIPNADTTYTITVTDSSNPPRTGSDTVVVGVNILAVSATAEETAVNPGESTTISAEVNGGNAPYTYSWSAQGWDGSDQAEVIVTPDQDTTYTVTVTDTSDPQQTASASVTVSVNTLTVNATADDPMVVPGQSTQLSAAVSGGTGPYQYQWTAQGWEGSDDPSPTVSPTDETTYTVTVTDSSDPPNTGSDTVTVAVNVLSVTAEASDELVDPGQTTTLSAQVSGGTPPYSYQWSGDGWTGSDNPSHTVTVNEGALYKVTVTDSSDPVQTASAVVTVRTTPATVVRLETTMGDIEIELNEIAAPVTVENFLTYVEEGFYDGADGLGATIFHRVIAEFMVQCGGFTAELVQKDTHDPIVNEASNGLKNDRGTVAMARTNEPDSATSQFYINVVDNDSLNYSDSNPGYAVFGKVVSGMDVVDAISRVHTTSQEGHDDVPVEPIVITAAYVVPQ